MKFYLCNTATGTQYARTQAEAKALDPKFATVNYDTDQAALVQRFNDLMAAAPAIETIDAPDLDPARITAIGRVLDEEDGGYPQEPPQKTAKGKSGTGSLDWQSAPEPGSCKRCIGMSDAARHIEGIMAATNIEYTLFTADAKLLDRVQAAIEDRRKELTI